MVNGKKGELKMEHIKIMVEFEPYIPKKEYYGEDASIDEMANIDMNNFDWDFAMDRKFKINI